MSTTQGLALHGSRGEHLRTLLAAAALAGYALWRFWPSLFCPGGCFVDMAELHNPGLAHFELVDTRLNAWILAWVQRALLHAPLDLFDVNAFYPAEAMLTGSEHLLGIALLTLPFRLFTQDAVTLHQWALFTETVVIGWTTLALVRWLTGSAFCALVAGWAAMSMPWRFAELSHVQTLAAHGFPLVWLLTFRILDGDRARWLAPVLAVVLGLQLLSSYYLAYVLTLSLAVIGGVATATGRIDLRSLRRLLGGVVPAYVAMGSFSLPYLMRRSRGELPASLDPERAHDWVAIRDALDFLAPQLHWGLPYTPPFPVTYSIPLVVLALALLGCWLPRKGSPRRSRAALVVGSLTLSAGVAFVFMLGHQIRWGDLWIKLPSYWAAAWVPGLANLRAPHRWGVLLGVAAPVLAGLGARRMLDPLGHAGFARWALCTAIAALLLFGLPRTRLPGQPAFPDRAATERTYAALARLPAGPVLEVPWHVDPFGYIDHDSRYLLASTLHWRPMLNGFTAYLPPSFHLLRRMAAALPAEDALERFRRAVDVRWIVLHKREVAGRERAAWQAAARKGRLRLAHTDPDVEIYEIPGDAANGMWLTGLRGEGAPSSTLAGLPKERLRLSGTAGQLEAVLPSRLQFIGHTALPKVASVDLTNASDVPWPGLGLERDGLVELRTIFATHDGALVMEGTSPIDVDVPGHATERAYPLVRGPTRRGSYRVCLDLVQRWEGALHPLPVPPVEVTVEAGGLDGRRDRRAGFAPAPLPEPAPETTRWRCGARDGTEPH